MEDLPRAYPQWIEAYRFEAVERTLRAYRRARWMRTLFVVIALAGAAARLAFPDAATIVLHIPVVISLIFLLSFVSLTAEWSTRRQYMECLGRYESLVDN